MMVLQLIVSASATARTPPRPNESASFAAHNLVPRSTRCGCSRSYFSRTIRFRSSRTFQYSRRFSCLPPRQSFSATRGIPLSAGSPNMLYHETEDLSSPTAVWEVISSRLLGIESPHRGPHSLRHACAGHLVAERLSLKEIGDHLGHRSAYATRTYAKVDLAGLGEVANFDLGGLS